MEFIITFNIDNAEFQGGGLNMAHTKRVQEQTRQ